MTGGTREALAALRAELGELKAEEERAAQILLAFRLRAEELADGRHRPAREVERIIGELREAEQDYHAASLALSRNHKTRRKLLETDKL